MANKKQTLSNALLDHVLSNVAFASPTSVELALYTVAPTATTGGTEVSAGTDSAYQRQSLTFGAASAGAAANTIIVAFPAAGAGANYNVVGVAILDGTSGDQLYFGTINKPITDGDELTFALGAITVTEN